MPIDPIKIFQGGESSLAGILQGGNTAITGILDRAIQVGRDISNKQMQQEQDMLSMRQQETALQQRRAENLSQDWEDSFRFAENKRQFDTKFSQATMEDARDFAANRSDTAWNQQRIAEQDILRSDQWNSEFGLRQDAAAREERRLGLAEDRVARQDQFDQNILSTKPEQRTGLMGFVDRVFGKGPQMSASEIDLRRGAAIRQGDAAAALDLSRQADALRAQEDNRMTEHQRVREARYQQQMNDRRIAAQDKAKTAEKERADKERQKALEDMVSNPDAFPSRYAHVKSTAHKYGSDAVSQSTYAADLARGQAIDKNRLQHEITVANESKTADEYARKLGVSDGGNEQTFALRRAFWEAVRNGTVATPSQAPARGLADDYGF